MMDGGPIIGSIGCIIIGESTKRVAQKLFKRKREDSCLVFINHCNLYNYLRKDGYRFLVLSKGDKLLLIKINKV